MRYSTFFKFIAIVLCAASLLGMVSSAAGIFFLTELGGKSVEEQYADRLENQALSYSLKAAEIYASRELGGAPQILLNYHYGNDWETQYFSWTKAGYIIRDGEGNVLQEKPIPDDSRGTAYEFEFAAVGPYMKVISTAPHEEYYPQKYHPQNTEPVEINTQVTVMPARENTAIGEVVVGYSDGSLETWPADGTQLGSLKYTGGDTIVFLSNIGEIPMGDGWYPSHISLYDMGGNVVYAANSNTMVLLGSGLNEDGVFQWLLPAGTVTAEAPAGVKQEIGEYTAYDAIPAQGVTVASMGVTYSNLQGEETGSESVGSADLIGTLFHTADGNAEFRSNASIVMDLPDDSIITRITFRDARNNMLFEAHCPGGVGIIEYDQNGNLIFRGQMPGTVIDEAIPQETEPEAPEEAAGITGFAREKLSIYAAPSMDARIVGRVNAWQEITVSAEKTFDGILWGQVSNGWVLMDKVLTEETDAEVFAMPRMLEETLPDEAPADGLIEETVPEVTQAVTEPVVPETAEAVPEPVTAAEDPPVPEESAAYPEENIEKALYYDGQDMIAEYVWESIPEGYTVTVTLAPGAMRNELGWALLRLAEVFRDVLLEALGICIAVFALCVVHLCCSAGRTRRNNEVRAGGLNRIPLDLYLAGGSFGIVGLVAAAVFGAEYFAPNDRQLAILCCGACAYGASLLLTAFFFAFVAQIKTPGGYWWRNTLCGRFLRLLAWCWKKAAGFCKKHAGPAAHGFFPWLRRSVSALWDNGKKLALWFWDTGKRLLAWLGMMLGKCFRWTTERLARFFGLLPITWQFLTTGFTLVVLLYAMMRTYKVGYILLGFGIFFAVILYAASAFAILLENAKRMSKGDLDSKVDDRMLIGGFRDFAERLNDLADVAVIAAQKQLKSERMKTELITNVSHDIKTPLTSIINYVDLLKKPHTEAQQEQYLEVLDRQSHRLKKLVDDLMEMSKASTGNLAVDLQVVDAGEAVNQALGEFADKLERAQLVPVFRQPEDQVCMMADGRLVWRVMSNLLGNAVKYALPGTRVYLDLMEMDGKVIISMKNISREELNVNADELLERFVRGDASRNTEGSGLGLNIARSLMELQKGQLQILVDGDLFKVTLIFPGV